MVQSANERTCRNLRVLVDRTCDWARPLVEVLPEGHKREPNLSDPGERRAEAGGEQGFGNSAKPNLIFLLAEAASTVPPRALNT